MIITMKSGGKAIDCIAFVDFYVQSLKEEVKHHSFAMTEVPSENYYSLTKTVALQSKHKAQTLASLNQDIHATLQSMPL
jgi:hypothetical protein